MFEPKRLFTAGFAKCKRNYLKTQQKYELIRTLIYYAISIILFVAGYIQTGSRNNLLTLVAVLGCLPASKSAISTIMYFRFQGCSKEAADTIAMHSEGLHCLYDCYFTSYSKNYKISHITVSGNTVCGFSEDKNFSENEFYKHISDLLKLDGHKDISIKIFLSLDKYTERMDQMKALDSDEEKTLSVMNSLMSVAL